MAATHALIDSVATLLTLALVVTCVVGIDGRSVRSTCCPVAARRWLQCCRALDPLDVSLHRLHVACCAGRRVLNTWKILPFGSHPVLLNVPP